MQNRTSGHLFIVAAPSGGGKTSLVRALSQSLTGIEVSVSHTTRDMRPGEVDGVDYFFISREAFMDKINHNDFLEHAFVFNRYYGTSLAQVNARLDAGIDVLLDIDWQGALQIRRHFPNAITIFIIPPSLASLKSRLLARGQDALNVVEERMQAAQDEISHYAEFDYLIINDTFDDALNDLKSIVMAARLKLSVQLSQHAHLISSLLSN